MRRILASSLLITSLCLSHGATAQPVFEALSAKRYNDALSIARNSDGLLRSYAQWSTLKEIGGHTYFSFNDAYGFFQSHAHWPLQNRVRMSVEAALFRDGASGDAARSFCRSYPPISGRGMIACAGLLSQGDSAAVSLIKQGWMQGDFDASEERVIRERYGALLTGHDHAARVERLLFEGKTHGALRALPLLPASSRAIAEARIALIGGARNADAKLAALPASSRNAPGIIFDRIRYRHKKGLRDSALELFAAAPANPPHGDAWWPLRHYYAREAIAKRQYQRAYNIVKAPGTLEREAKAEALWLAGWLQYEFLNNPRGAYEDFYKLFDAVSTPVSKARAAYWAGRSAERNGNSDIASDWYTRAAEYPTVFYGQLAIARRSPGASLSLPSTPSASGSIRSGEQQLLNVAHLLSQNGFTDMARVFLEQVAAGDADDSHLATVADRLRTRGEMANAVRLAKAALRRNVVLLDYGWPKRAVPQGAAIEPALTLAITRQESEFDPQARSSANAQGLMQLLPATASQTARKNGITLGNLYQPDTNMLLGSAYLAELIGNAGGSYVAAIAGYNAGPGNMQKWIAANGRPGQSIDQTLRWLESIPFGETRNYVQRVIENLQIYRARLQPNGPLLIEKDLLR